MTFWESDTYRIVQAMKATGNQPGVIAGWVEAMCLWAAANNSPDANAVKLWASVWQVRPFYTAQELVPLWRVLPIVLGFSTRLSEAKSPRRLENELDFVRLPRLAQAPDYFIVERIHYWRNNKVSETAWNTYFNGKYYARVSK